MRKLGAILSWLAASSWFGGMLFFSFFVAPATFKYFPDMAGKIVDPYFAAYFPLGYVCAALMLIGSYLQTGGLFKHWKVMLSGVLLVVALYGGLVIGAKAKSVKHDLWARNKFEDRTDPARKEFSKLHGISMGLNLIAFLGAGLWIAGGALEKEKSEWPSAQG